MVNPNYLTHDNNYEMSLRPSSSSILFCRTKDIETSITTTAVLAYDSCLLSSDNMIAIVNHQDEHLHTVDLERLGELLVHAYKYYMAGNSCVKLFYGSFRRIRDSKATGL
jgi:hypothetical protein